MKKLQLCVGGLLLTAIFVLGLFMNQLSAQTPPTEVVFTTSNFTTWDSDGQDYSWQVPAGVNEIAIIAIGGGGGGGAACQFSGWQATHGYPGGGGGAWVKSTIAVTPGETLNIHAGSKGSGDCSKSATNPGWGGNSWVSRGSTILIRATGAGDVGDGSDVAGVGGQLNGPRGTCIGDDKHPGGNGGTGSDGAWCGAGGGGAAGGGNGGNGANGGPISGYKPGAGGTTSLAHAGNGAEGAVSHTGGRNGKNGSNYGGGGSGCATGAGIIGGGFVASNGGDGAPGAVFIYYTASNCNNLTAGAISAGTWTCSSTDTAVVLNNVTAAHSEVTGTYIWQKNGTTISGANGATYTATTSGTYRRGYQVTGCSTVYTDAVTVTRPSDVNPGTLTDNENKTVKNVCKNSDVSVNLIASNSGNITWQQSTDRVNWTDVTSVTPFTVNNITQDVYVRFVYNYTTTCGVPSNNIYTIHAYNRPVVNSLTAPTNLCPNQSSYSIVADATAGGDAIITTYNWTGAAGSETGTIVPSANDCGNTYNYSLTVTDNNGCTSDSKPGSFTVSDDVNPTVGTITAAPAAVDPSTCNYLVPDLSEAVKAATGTGDNCTSNDDLTVVQNPAANTPITATETTVNYWVVDKCGHESEHKQLTLTRPDITTSDAANITIAPTEVNVTLYFGACDTAYTFPEPTVTIDIPEYSGALELTHTALPTRLEPGTYNITWTISDPCGNSVQRPQTITVVYPDCPTATIDGYTYQSVRIGCECWTTENLRNTKYSNGNSIAVANIYNSTDYPDETANLNKFGRLYSWYSAMNVPEGNNSATPTTTNSPVGPFVQGACPEGWAIPTEADYLTMRNIAGSLPNVKSPDVTTWLPGHAGNDPGSGFKAKGAGYYDGSTSQYMNLLGQTDFWTSTTTSDVTKGVCSEITHVCPEMLIMNYDKGLGFSIRCIKR